VLPSTGIVATIRSRETSTISMPIFSLSAPGFADMCATSSSRPGTVVVSSSMTVILLPAAPVVVGGHG
jgi:hypothetical protein